MEAVKLRYEAVRRALATLKEGMEEIEVPLLERPKAYALMRDGVIQ